MIITMIIIIIIIIIIFIAVVLTIITIIVVDHPLGDSIRTNPLLLAWIATGMIQGKP